MAGQLEDIPWREAVPRFAEGAYDVQVEEMDKATFIEAATTIIAAFEGRFQPGQPAIRRTQGDMAAGTVGVDPIEVIRHQTVTIVDAVLPRAYHSASVWTTDAMESQVPMSHPGKDATVNLLRYGAKIDGLKRRTSPESIAVGTEEITAFVKRQEYPMMELAALVALQGAGIEVGPRPKPETRTAGISALITEASELAFSGDLPLMQRGVRKILSLVDVNGVLQAERDELEPRILEEVKSLAEQRGYNPVDRQLGLILDQMFPDGTAADQASA